MTKLLLIKAILEKAIHYSWSLQGLGMLRLHLSPSTASSQSGSLRLHVWDDRYAVPGVSQIHSHPWNFTSEIIAGSLTNIRYEGNTPISEGNTHYRQLLHCGPGGCLKSVPELVYLRPATSTAYDSGKRYYQTFEEVHHTEAERGTVTLVHREMPRGGNPDEAYVYWPFGESWVSAEPRMATAEEVRDITGFSLERWF